MTEWANNFWRDESGQDLVEYTLIITIFALMTAALVTGEVPSITTMWTAMQNHLTLGSSVAAGS
jgi:Flp pilus assembly pilin Flp